MVKVNLFQLRVAAGLSQEAVARGVGCSMVTYRAAEKGGNVSLKLALRLARFFDTTVNDIWQTVDASGAVEDDRPNFVMVDGLDSH